MEKADLVSVSVISRTGNICSVLFFPNTCLYIFYWENRYLFSWKLFFNITKIATVVSGSNALTSVFTTDVIMDSPLPMLQKEVSVMALLPSFQMSKKHPTAHAVRIQP